MNDEVSEFKNTNNINLDEGRNPEDAFQNYPGEFYRV